MNIYKNYNGVDPDQPAIYLFTLVWPDRTEKEYVGRTVKPKRRIRRYERNIERRHAGGHYRYRRVHEAMYECQNDGGNVFLTLLENTTKDKLPDLEQQYINLLKPSLNATQSSN